MVLVSVCISYTFPRFLSELAEDPVEDIQSSGFEAAVHAYFMSKIPKGSREHNQRIIK